MNAETGADFGELVRHASAAGDAVDQPLGAFENAGEDFLGRTHFPQNVHVDAAFATRRFMGHAGLIEGALDGVIYQFPLSLPPGCSMVDLADQVAFFVIAVGVDGGEGADSARCRPGSGALAFGYGNTFSTLDQGQDLAAGNHQGFKRNHAASSFICQIHPSTSQNPSPSLAPGRGRKKEVGSAGGGLHLFDICTIEIKTSPELKRKPFPGALGQWFF